MTQLLFPVTNESLSLQQRTKDKCMHVRSAIVIKVLPENTFQLIYSILTYCV